MVAYISKHLPGSSFPRVDELSARAVVTDESKINAGLRSIDNLHLGVLRAQLDLYPSRMGRVDLNVSRLQFSRQVNGELIQRRLRCVSSWLAPVFSRRA
ncbi:hypothetical protein BDD14_6363 [Edaphobacter modestus]|uniref:Uncharacterized protein n=1 Tax=Edaphobacter modestus TaxID=388466 RepID=A0A4V6MFI3_9BACT|nr:hypothetical protein BDD14_6363 [Edaphobacter modestus]